MIQEGWVWSRKDGCDTVQAMVNGCCYCSGFHTGFFSGGREREEFRKRGAQV